MIQLQIKSKQYHGDYYVTTIYHSVTECKGSKGTIVDYKELTPDNYKGTFVVSKEGLVVPVLKVVQVKQKYGMKTFIYFPKLRFNAARKEFSYNLDLVCKDRYRLNYNEKLFAGHIISGVPIYQAAVSVWLNKKHGYYYNLIKRLFNDYDFIDFLFSEMSKTLKQELEERGINRGTIADKVAEYITGKRTNIDTGEIESYRVPQNLTMWALNKASDVLDRGSTSPTLGDGGISVTPQAMKELMMQTTMSANHHTASNGVALLVDSVGNSHVARSPLADVLSEQEE